MSRKARAGDFPDTKGGSNVGNSGGTWAHHGEWGGRPFHLSLKLPPLGVVFLKLAANN